MGGVALVLLLGAELGLSVLAFGRTIAEHLASYGSPAGALGLAGQVAFALFPLLRRTGGRAAPPAASPHDCSAENRRHVRSSQDDPP
jgi:hypothetical protein